jgi:ABC-type sugar transport system permease subunit/ABC-type glycerol-3-phosphate transport system substrate-binding protein
MTHLFGGAAVTAVLAALTLRFAWSSADHRRRRASVHGKAGAIHARQRRGSVDPTERTIAGTEVIAEYEMIPHPPNTTAKAQRRSAQPLAVMEIRFTTETRSARRRQKEENPSLNFSPCSPCLRGENSCPKKKKSRRESQGTGETPVPRKAILSSPWRSWHLGELGAILFASIFAPLRLRGLIPTILTIALLAFPAFAKTRIEVPIFEGGEGTPLFLYASREFEKIRPDVEIDLYGDPRIADQVRVRILEGSFFEATDANIDFWPLIHIGDVLPMDAYLDGPNWEGDSTWRASFVTGTLDPYIENGKTYGIPSSLFANVIWYNRQMFEQHGWKPPATWEEFFDLCEKIRAAGIDPLAFQGRYPYYAEPIFASVYYGVAGLDAYRDFRNVRAGAFDNPATVRAFDVTQRFASYFQPGAMGMSHTEAQMQFLLGKVAMIPCGTWFKSEMMGKIPDGFRLGTFNLPYPRGGRGDPTAINAFSGYFFVMSRSAHPKEAVDFLRFLSSRRVAGEFARQRDLPSAVKGSDKGNLSADMADVERIVGGATSNYGNAGESVFVQYPAMFQFFDGVMTQILTGKISPQDAAKKLESDAAAVRMRAENPSSISVRHPMKAVVLLALLAVAVLFLGVRAAVALRDRRAMRAVEEPPGGRLGWRDLLLFTLPAVVIYAAFVIIPAVRAFAWSLYSWDGISSRDHMAWVGLLNFKRLLLESDAFWSALGNNLFLMLVVPLFVVPLALFLAACLSRGVWGSSLFRIVFFFPNLLGTVAATFLWLHLYNPQGGLVNAILTAIGLKQFVGFAWLSADHLYWALIPMSVWALCGFNMVLYLAAMQAVPKELYEAADLEGATPWRQFWSVTIPLIWDMLAISLVFMILAGMKAFDVIWLLTNQHPSDQTNVIGTRLVQVMFNEFSIGDATAMAVVLFLLVFIGSATSMQVMRREAVEL